MNDLPGSDSFYPRCPNSHTAAKLTSFRDHTLQEVRLTEDTDLVLKHHPVSTKSGLRQYVLQRRQCLHHGAAMLPLVAARDSVM